MWFCTSIGSNWTQIEIWSFGISLIQRILGADEGLSNARNVSHRNCLRWPIYLIISVEKTLISYRFGRQHRGNNYNLICQFEAQGGGKCSRKLSWLREILITQELTKIRNNRISGNSLKNNEFGCDIDHAINLHSSSVQA